MSKVLNSLYFVCTMGFSKCVWCSEVSYNIIYKKVIAPFFFFFLDQELGHEES
jgi:hypothetical protein